MSQPISENAVLVRSELPAFLKICENPTSRDAAEAENHALDVARHTRDVLASYLPDGPVGATPLREHLPRTMNAVFREEMRARGIDPSILYRIRNGSQKRVTRRNFERIAIALEHPELDDQPEIPVCEIAGDVMRAAYVFYGRGEREAGEAASLWYAAYADRDRSDPRLSDLPDEVL
jgi:hypothetical protein